MRDNTVNLKNAEAEEDWNQSAPAAAPMEAWSGRAKHPRRRLVKVVWGVAAIIVIVWAWSVISSGMAWRAVFLSNNQVYFGHFWSVPFASTITLNDVYYLQVAQANQQLSGEDQSSLKLVKLGNEIHGPPTRW